MLCSPQQKGEPHHGVGLGHALKPATTTPNPGSTCSRNINRLHIRHGNRTPHVFGEYYRRRTE